MKRHAETERLAAIAQRSVYARGANAAMQRYSIGVLSRFWRGERCLELGPAEGLITEALIETFPAVTAVDGSPEFCAELRERFPTVEVVASLFEDFAPAERFDTIVMAHVLEHVADPLALLRGARDWLHPGGVLLAVVPNANSLHRQAAVLLGMLQRESDLNETDVRHGHRRVYDTASLHADATAAGFAIEASGGFWLKPLSSAQIEEAWTDAMLDAFMELGERYPDTAAEIYVVGR